MKALFVALVAVFTVLTAWLGDAVRPNVLWAINKKGRKPAQRSKKIWVGFFASLSMLVVFSVFVAETSGETAPQVPTHTPSVPVSDAIHTAAPSLEDTQIASTSLPPEPSAVPPVVGDCLSSNFAPPCWYYLTHDVGVPETISKFWFDDFQYAGLIAALNRKSDGTIDRYLIGQKVLIPEPEEKLDLDFYLKYFPLLGIEIFECEENLSKKPCIYVLPANMTLQGLVERTYPGLSPQAAIEQFNRANSVVLYEQPQSYPPIYLGVANSFQAGQVVVLPSIP